MTGRWARTRAGKGRSDRRVPGWRLASVAVAVLVACTDSEPTRPGVPGAISVMTWNVYIGIDVVSFLDVESRSELPLAGAEAWRSIQATDFPERAEALASRITERAPDLVGLQEVTLVRMQSPGDFLLGNGISATDTVLDYLSLLVAALKTRGADYAPVAISEGTDLEGPLLTPTGFSDLRVTDREVILARKGLPIRNVREENFTTNLVISDVGDTGLSVTVVKGWVSVDVTLDPGTLRFVSTHLEIPLFGPEVQIAQAEELIAALEDGVAPVVLVGDFNSAADGSTTQTYDRFIDAGFRDAWIDASASGPGPTCCHASDLRNPMSGLSQRIDLVLFRGGLEALRVGRFGEEPGDRTASGLWPSDHAGVAASLRLP